MPAVSYRPHYKIPDYLAWEGDWEFWDGVPVSMSPSPNTRHQRTGLNLVHSIHSQILDQKDCNDCQLFYEIDWHVSDNTVVRPDLLIVCGEVPEDFIKSPPVFIAEILSPSTAEKDRTAKRDLYAAEGVRYYLILDPDAEEAEFLVHNAETGAYESADSVPVKLDLHAGCRISLDLEKVW